MRIKQKPIFDAPKPQAEVAHLVEHQPSKLRVAGSSPVFRSKYGSGSGFVVIVNTNANVAQLVEHIHGKDEVTSSILVIGSNS